MHDTFAVVDMYDKEINSQLYLRHLRELLSTKPLHYPLLIFERPVYTGVDNLEDQLDHPNQYLLEMKMD